MKYFVITDVHGFYDEAMDALMQAGYDMNNPDHFLISCGDMFDRGTQAKEMLDFLMSVPRERRAYVRGNHEELLESLVRGKRAKGIHDLRNRTVDTILQLGYSDDYKVALNRAAHDRELREYFDSLLDYYETKDYVFVHGWLPCIRDGYDTTGYVIKDWRTRATVEDWYDSRWVCGFDTWARQPDAESKTVVCGHWHTSYAHRKYHHNGYEFPSESKMVSMSECCFEPFIDKGIVGLDSCTALTKKVNVFCFEE